MTRFTHRTTAGASMLVLGISLVGAIGPGNSAAAPPDLKGAIMKITAAVQAGNNDLAAKEAQELVKKAKFDGCKPVSAAGRLVGPAALKGQR